MSDENEWPTESPTGASDGRPDLAIVPYVKQLHRHDVETFQSCSGHVHQDGTKSSGTLWFDAVIDVSILVDSDAINHVKRMYKPEECWEIVFPGLAHSEESLAKAMFDVCRSLDTNSGGDDT